MQHALRFRLSPTALFAVLIVLGVLLSGITARIRSSPSSASRHAPIQARAAAIARWSEQSFARYRLIVEENAGECRQDVVVEHEQVASVRENTCSHPARTIADLFSFVKQTQDQMISSSAKPLVHTPEMLQVAQCAGACVCNVLRSIRARYDPRLGFPTEIQVWRHEQAEWAKSAFWRRVWLNQQLPSCVKTSLLRSSPSQNITIRAVIPLS